MKYEKTKMKKILMAAINARYTHSNLALYYLRTIGEKYHYDCRVIQSSINKGKEQFLNELREYHFDVLVLSVYIWNAVYIKEVLPDLLEQLPDIQIVAGGPEVSYNPRDWAEQFPCISYIIVGGGEKAFAELCESGFSSAEKIIHVPNYTFDEIPFPYQDEDFFVLKNRYIYYESSRGCLFKCSYCLSSRNDQVLDFKATDAVKNELQFMLKYKPQIIKFVDRTFNAKKKHARGIWEFLIENSAAENTCFHFEIFPELLEDRDFKILAQARPGLFQFEIGVQTITTRVLHFINRRSEWHKVKRNIERLVKLNTIHLHVDQLAGLPGETKRLIIKSFNAIYGLRADHFQLGLLKVLPGTPLASDVKRFSIIHKETPPYVITGSKWCSPAFIEEVTQIADLVNLFYNSGRYSKTMYHFEKYFRSPYHMYAKLNAYMQSKEITLSTKEWSSGAGVVLHYIRKCIKNRGRLFLFDCLVWDYFSQARTHRLPSLLRERVQKTARQTVMDILEKYKHGNTITYDNHTFQADLLKQSLLFVPHTKKFKQLYMKTAQAVVFLPGGKRLFLKDE